MVVPPFWNQLNSNNSAVIQSIHTKFGMNTKNKVLEQNLPTKFILNKIQDGGGRHIEIYIYVHIAYICAKFDTEAANGS